VPQNITVCHRRCCTTRRIQGLLARTSCCPANPFSASNAAQIQVCLSICKGNRNPLSDSSSFGAGCLPFRAIEVVLLYRGFWLRPFPASSMALYSFLKVMTGSRRAARHAGSTPATAPRAVAKPIARMVRFGVIRNSVDWPGGVDALAMMVIKAPRP
jgi:hypothetical protein